MVTAAALALLGCGRAPAATAAPQPTRFGCAREADVWALFAVGAVQQWQDDGDVQQAADYLLSEWRRRGGGCPHAVAAGGS